MAWLGKRRRKKNEEQEEEQQAEVEAQEPASSTGPEVLVLVPEVPGAPTFKVNRFHSADDAIGFIKASVSPQLFSSAHIFWAMHEGPPPDVGASAGEALVLIRAGDDREAVHVVSFVDLESAVSFARFEVKRGLDIGFVLIYWAAFAQVIETPFGLRLDPPGPPDPRQWRAAAIAASHSAPAPMPHRREPATMQAGDDYGPELRLMPETKLPEAPPRATPREEPRRQVFDEPAMQPAAVEEPVVRAFEEPAIEEAPPEEATNAAEPPTFQPSVDQTPEPNIAEPIAEAVEAEPELDADEPLAVQEPGTEAAQVSGVPQVDLDPAAEHQPVVEVIEPEAIAEDSTAIDEPTEAIPEASEPEGALAASEHDAAEEEIVVPPEFAAEPETVAQESTNGHHADEEIPDYLSIDAPVQSTEGDEEVAERLLTEALGPEPAEAEPGPEQIVEGNLALEPAVAEETAEVVAETPLIYEQLTPHEAAAPDEDPAPSDDSDDEPAPRRKKKAKAAAAAKGKRKSGDDDDDEEEEIIPVDVNEVVEKTLRVKRWTKQEEPFKGFESPPGRF